MTQSKLTKRQREDLRKRNERRVMDHIDRCRGCRADIIVYTPRQFKLCPSCTSLHFTLHGR